MKPALIASQFSSVRKISDNTNNDDPTQQGGSTPPGVDEKDEFCILVSDAFCKAMEGVSWKNDESLHDCKLSKSQECILIRLPQQHVYKGSIDR